MKLLVKIIIAALIGYSCSAFSKDSDYKSLHHLAEGGDSEAQVEVGICHAKGDCAHKDYREAKKWWVEAARGGNAKAQMLLGLLYLDNKEGVEQNLDEAFRLLSLSAEQGEAQAQYYLAAMYSFGKGIPNDYKQSTKWYLRAAVQGHAEAQYNLGASYASGIGVPKDLVEAHHWISLSAEQGFKPAEDALPALKKKISIIKKSKMK